MLLQAYADGDQRPGGNDSRRDRVKWSIYCHVLLLVVTITIIVFVILSIIIYSFIV